MRKIDFYDANITLGTENVVARGRYIDEETLRRRLDECGIFGGLVVHNASIEGDPADGNRMIADALSRWAGFKPVWSVVPLSTGEMGTAEELRRALSEARVRGVVFYPSSHRYPPGEWLCHDLFDLLEAMRMPLFTRADIDMSWDQIATMLAAHKHLVLVIRNTGYASTRMLYRLLETHEHLRIETSRYFPFRGIEDVVHRFGADRLIFGSGAPTYSPGAAVTPVLLADLSDEDRSLIAGKTLRTLTGGIRYDA